MRLLRQVILGSFSEAKREKETGLSGRSPSDGTIGLQVPAFTTAHGRPERTGRRHGICGGCSGVSVVHHRLHPSEGCNSPSDSPNMVSRDRSARYYPLG